MSKFPGPHIHSTARTDLVLRYLATCRPSVVKFMDAGLNAELLDAAKAIGALVVARPYRDPQEMNTAGRRAMLRDAESILRAWPQVDAVEGFNEAFQGGQELQERAGFDVDLMLLAERYGRKAVIGSFSVGMPDLPDHDRAEQWRLYLPALKRAGDQGHYVGLHEYGAPTLLWGVGAGNQTSDLVDGRWAPVKPAADAHGWFCLRYRQVVDVWRSLGLVTLPRIVISEFGLDDIQPRPAVGTRRGYKTYRDSEWWRHPSSGSFAEQCGWMASRWAEDPLVVGGVIFDFSDNTGKWDDFDPTTDPETFDELLRIGAKMATTPPKEPPVADLNALLAAEFGPGFYDDLRPLMADRPGFNTRPMAGVEAIAIHHTAGSRQTSWVGIRDGHWARGFSGIGYHIGVRMGRVAYLGDVGRARACVAGQNHRLICLVFTGDYTKGQPDPGDLALARRVVKVLDAFLGRKLPLRGHSDFDSTACPGPALYSQIPGLRAAAGTPPVPTPGPALLVEVGKQHRLHGITLNASAALQRAIRADGLIPTTRELEIVDGGVTYIAQRGEAIAGGGAVVYYVVKGQWDKVWKIPAP